MLNKLPPAELDDPREAYLEWLHMEARLLRMELYGGMDADRSLTPCGTFASSFHLPTDRDWRQLPQPSTRALTVLRSVGVEIPEGAAA